MKTLYDEFRELRENWLQFVLGVAKGVMSAIKAAKDFRKKQAACMEYVLDKEAVERCVRAGITTDEAARAYKASGKMGFSLQELKESLRRFQRKLVDKE